MERIDRLNPRLNAVVTSMAHLAVKSIQDLPSSGPFRGVPFLLKDLLAAYAGVPLTSGCKALKKLYSRITTANWCAVLKKRAL